MNFFSWHYSKANNFIFDVWGNYLTAAWHFFSVGMLLKTLFSPWRRVVGQKKSLGFSFQDFFERSSFNLISRIIGFLVRAILLSWGLVILLVILILGPAVMFIWQACVPFSWIIWLYTENNNKNETEEILGITKDPAEILNLILNKPEGRFVRERLGLEPVNIIHSGTFDWEKYKSCPTALSGLLFILARDYEPFNKFLFDRQIKPEDVLKVASWFEKSGEQKRKLARFWEKDNLLKGSGLGWDFSFGFTPNLDQYSRDLIRPTPFFRQLVGREKEVARIEEILSTSGENNVLLVGDPGVGKHTIILGFARKVWQGQVRLTLAYKRVLALDVNRIISQKDLPGAKNMMADLLSEAQSAGNIILVIDNIEKFASVRDGNIDLIEVFENYIAGSKLQIIAVTTGDNFSKYLSANEKFLKLFEKIDVVSPDKSEALNILMAVVPDFEKGKRVKVSFQALSEIISLSDRLINDIPFPEKAINLLDQVISKYSGTKENYLVTAEDIRNLVGEKIKIPLGAISALEEDKLKNIENVLSARVVGQKEAIAYLSSGLRRARMGIAGHDKPLGSFLFLGPTGVGKTETAKALASEYFGDEKRIIRFDMSQFQEAGSLDNFTNQLLTKVKDSPFAVLLLDELEKADKRLLDIFLTVFDEGYLSDFRGKKVSFTDLIIIATSNAAGEFVREQIKTGISPNNLRTAVIEFVQKEGLFSPEFLNRFDGIVVYQPLSMDESKQIAGLQLTQLNKRLAVKDLALEITPELTDSVAQGGYSREFGARPMKRWIADQIESKIAESMLSGELKRGDKITAGWDETSKTYKLNKI